MARTITGSDLATLAELVARSLIRRAGERYEMHELIKRYAAERLEADGATAAREAHARAFAQRLVSRTDRLRGAESPAARNELRPDLPDIEAAAAWAVGHWRSDEVVPLLQGLTVMWVTQVDPVGPPVMRTLGRVVDEERDPTLDAVAGVSMRTKLAAYLAVSLASIDANRESDAVVDERLERVRASGDQWDLATCLLARGMNHCNRDENADAIAPLEEASALYDALGDGLMQVDALVWLGWAQLLCDEVATARESFEQAKQLALAVGDPVTIAFTESKLGALDDAEGRPADALRRHLDAFAHFDAAGNVGGLGFCLSRAGLSSYVLGDYRSALDFAMAGYQAFRDLGHGWGSSIAAERIAFAYLGLGQLDVAREWAMQGMRLVTDGAHARLGRLSALAAVAASYIRGGQATEWLPILRAVVADPDMPAVYAIQPRQELALAEAGAGGELVGDPTREAADLDATISRLLRAEMATHASP